MKPSPFKKIAVFLLAAVCCLALTCCASDAGTNSSSNVQPEITGTPAPEITEAPTPEPTEAVRELSMNEANLYMVHNAEDLVLYRDMFDKAAQEFHAEHGPSDIFLFPGLILMEDIDLFSVCGAEPGSWKPIGADAYCTDSSDKYYDAYFTGTFEGNGKTISGLYINDPENGGALIQCIWEGTVKNLTIADSTILSVNENGGGSYSAAISVEARDGLIENCVIESSVTIEGDAAAAGFIGKAESWNCSCAVRSCKNYASIRTSGIAGGIVASASKKVYIIGCENHGDISSFGDGATALGGIVGIHSGTSSYGGSVYGCINYGSVTEAINEKNNCVAGIAGSSDTTIQFCANAGTITGFKKAFDITHYDRGARRYNANYGTVASGLDPQYAISAVYKKSSYKGINYPLGTPALTDGSALAEIIANAGEYWMQGEQFPIWNGKFSPDFPDLRTNGSIVK